MQQGGAVEAAFAPKGNTQLIPNSYQLSKGSLPLHSALVPKVDSESAESFSGTAFKRVGVLASNVAFGEYNHAQLWKMLFGLELGDQLTFPQIYGEGVAQALSGGSGYLDKTLYTDFCAPRLVLKESVDEEATCTIDSDTTSEQLLGYMIEAVNEDATWFDAENILMYLKTQNVGQDSLDIILDRKYDDAFAINNDDPLRAIGCIRSHKDVSSRQWQYSTSNLVCVWADNGRGLELSDYFGFTLANAIDTYKKNVILDSDGNFLQRGTDDNIVPPSFQ